MKTLFPALLAGAVAAALCAGAVAAPPAPAQFLAARGGTLSDPVSVDSHVYLATGTTLTAWDRQPDGSLVATGDTRTTPVQGWLTGLTRHGDYLYASYRGYDSAVAGVAVYSIADRNQPQLLGQYGNYSTAAIRMPESIAVANGYLYLLDSEQGIFASPLTSPAVPAFTCVSTAWGNYDHAYVHGDRLYTVGRTFLSSTALDIYDLTTPTAPQLLGTANLDGYDNFRLKVQPPYAYGFGLAVAVSDLSNPTSIQPRGRVDAPVAYDAVLLGSHAWSVGLQGLDIWHIGDPDQPVAVGHADIDTFATDATAVADNEALLATRSDRLVRLDASQPATPALRGQAQLAAGTAAYDLAMRGDKALILGNAYGLNVAARNDLAPLARFETSLEPSLQGRAFEQLAVDGDRAYLSSWGSGLVIADVSNPLQAQQVGFWEYPFATGVAAQGNFAYVGRSTNGGELVVVDVTNPAAPQPRGALTTAKIMRLAVHGQHVFVADESPMGDADGGFLIVDVSNPDLPQLTSRYSEDCGSVRDFALDPSGRRALVACFDHVRLLDIRNRSQPQLLGRYDGGGYSVALRGNTAYVGSDTGLDEVDFTNPAQPQLLAHWDLPTSASRLQAPGDGRVYALTGMGGVYTYEPDRLFADGAE